LLTLGHNRSDGRRHKGVVGGQTGSLNGSHGGVENKSGEWCGSRWRENSWRLFFL
jgi:hypothetical protein